MNRDLVFGIATLAIALVYYALTSTIPPSELADPIGAQGLPRIYSFVLAALSMLLIVRSLRLSNREPRTSEPRTSEPRTSEPRTIEPRTIEPRTSEPRTSEPSEASHHRAARVAGMLLIGVVYILVIPYLGYVVSVATLIAVTTYLQGGALNGRTVLVALSGAALFWAVFIWLLRIQYPAGLWPSLI